MFPYFFGVTVYFKSTSSFAHDITCGHGYSSHGTKKDNEQSQLCEHRSKGYDSHAHAEGHSRGGSHSHGRGNHLGEPRSDHTTVEVVLDQATISSDSHKLYKGKDGHQEQSHYKQKEFSGHGRVESHGKPYQGQQTDDHD